MVLKPRRKQAWDGTHHRTGILSGFGLTCLMAYQADQLVRPETTRAIAINPNGHPLRHLEQVLHVCLEPFSYLMTVMTTRHTTAQEIILGFRKESPHDLPWWLDYAKSPATSATSSRRRQNLETCPEKSANQGRSEGSCVQPC